MGKPVRAPGAARAALLSMQGRTRSAPASRPRLPLFARQAPARFLFRKDSSDKAGAATAQAVILRFPWGAWALLHGHGPREYSVMMLCSDARKGPPDPNGYAFLALDASRLRLASFGEVLPALVPSLVGLVFSGRSL